MHPIIQKFQDQTIAVKAAAAAGSLLLMSFVYYQYFYSEKATQRTELEEKIESLNQSITQKRKLAKDLEKYRREVKDLEIKLKFALQELPDKREIPDLLSSISNLAKDAGLEVSLFKPGGEITKEFYAEVPVNISVEGSFHQVATFFDEVAHLNRIVNINNISMSGPKVGEQRISVKTDCVATTFRYLDDTERVAAADGGASQGQGRRRKN